MTLPFTPDKPIVCLAPMDGYTDLAFRRLVKEINPRVLVFTEMVSANALKHLSSRTAARFDTHDDEAPLIVQLFGKNPEAFREATQLILQTRAAGIDINMGCPAKKILKSGHGSDLIRNPDLAAEIVATVKEEIVGGAHARPKDFSLSVKTRLGWTDSSTLIDFGHKMQDAGADFITIHGRTVKQAFSGQADWEPIYELQKNLKIPVIGNGDIQSEQEARERMSPNSKSCHPGLDPEPNSEFSSSKGVMIGRAAFGNPFLFADFNNDFWGSTNPIPKSNSGLPRLTSSIQPLSSKLPWILKHCEFAIENKGERIGMMEMRKHLVKYASGFSGAAKFRARLVQVENITQVQAIFEEIIWESEK